MGGLVAFSHSYFRYFPSLNISKKGGEIKSEELAPTKGTWTRLGDREGCGIVPFFFFLFFFLNIWKKREGGFRT